MLDPEVIINKMASDKISMMHLLSRGGPEKQAHLAFFRQLIVKILPLYEDILNEKLNLATYMESKRRLLVYLLKNFTPAELELRKSVLFYVPGENFIANRENLLAKLKIVMFAIVQPRRFLAALDKSEAFFLTNSILGLSGANNQKYAEGVLTVGELFFTQPNVLLRNLYFFLVKIPA